MDKILVIIVNYNTKDVLVQCLNNLSGMRDIIDVVVVDNGSSDDSYEKVKKNFSWVNLIKEKNLGIAHGYNVGIKGFDAKYILYLGTDAFPSREVIVGLYDFMESNLNVGISTAKLVLRGGALDMDAHRGLPTPWAALTHFSKLNKLFPNSKFLNQYFVGGSDMTKPHKIGLCISHFMFVRSSVFVKIIKWDEDFFVFGEDVDFCYRVQQAGWDIYYLPQYEVLHLKGVSVGTRKTTKDISKASIETKRRMKKMSTSAMKLFYKKHYENKYPFFVTRFVYLAIWFIEKIRTSRV